MIGVLRRRVTSPKLLYLIQSRSKKMKGSRLVVRIGDAAFDVPLEQFARPELIDLAISGKLKEADVLSGQTERMLADPRADRFSKHFVRQWLGMQLLDYFKSIERCLVVLMMN